MLKQVSTTRSQRYPLDNPKYAVFNITHRTKSFFRLFRKRVWVPSCSIYNNSFLFYMRREAYRHFMGSASETLVNFSVDGLFWEPSQVSNGIFLCSSLWPFRGQRTLGSFQQKLCVTKDSPTECSMLQWNPSRACSLAVFADIMETSPYSLRFIK